MTLPWLQHEMRRWLLGASSGSVLLACVVSAVAQTQPGRPAPPPTQIRAPAAAAPSGTAAATPNPTIVSVRPATCISPGATLFIQTRNFAAASGQGVAIGGNGAHIDLRISADLTSVVAVVPSDANIQQGATYFVGIEKADHSAWLSNQENLTPCAAPAGVPASASSPAAADVSSLAPGAPTKPVATAAGASPLGALPPAPAAQPSAALNENVTVEPAEVVVVSADMQEAQQVQQQAQALGMSIKRRSALGSLGLVLSVLRLPKDLAVADALAQLRRAMPNVWLDANHRYDLQAGPEVSYGPKLVRWPSAPQTCAAGMRIGLIDTAIDLQHPVLMSKAVTGRSFLASGVVPAPADHGTAVASLLVGDAGIGLMPAAELRAAAVFRSRGKNEVDTTAELVAQALDWLAGEKVAAIDLSFGGQRNQLVEAAIVRVGQLGIQVFAAAGNAGPDAPPVYPAAQPGVVAVTAVDANLKPYPHANRGDYIAYAAPGVDVRVAATGGESKYASGTSYAVPFVTAVFAATKAAQPAAAWAALDKAIQSRVKDLGAPGRDRIFGWGLIQAAGECSSVKK